MKGFPIVMLTNSEQGICEWKSRTGETGCKANNLGADWLEAD